MMTKIEMQAMDAVIGIHREMRKGNEPNWEQRRYEIAKDVMCAMLSNPELSGRGKFEVYSVEMADKLIAQLKKEK